MLFTSANTNPYVQFTISIGLFRNLLRHDVGHGRQGRVAKASSAVDAALRVLLKGLLEMKVGFGRDGKAVTIDENVIPAFSRNIYTVQSKVR